MMERQKIITIVAVLVIFGTVTFSFLNIYALEKLELSGIDDNFRFFVMSTDDKIKICNDSPLPANFNQFNIIIFYEGKVLGTFIVDAASIMPYSVLEVDGKYKSDSYAQSQALFMTFDHMFMGSSPTVRIDPQKLAVVTEFKTTMIGIPYSVTEQQTGFEFWNMLNDENNLKC
jgi:hypothetical protein